MSIDVTLTSYILNPWTNSGSTPIGYHGGTSNLIALSYANLDFTPSASDPYKSTSGDVFKVYVNGVRIYRQSDQDYAGGSGFLEDGDTSGQTLNGVSAAWTATNNTVWEINTALQLILLNVDSTTGVASTTLYGPSGLNVSFAESSSSPIIELRRAVQDLKTPAIDFSNASILTEQDLDNSAKNVFHVSQQAVISTENAMLFDSGTDTYKATQPGTSNAKRISNVATPTSANDAANKAYVDGGSDVQTVASISSDVTTVAGISSNVTSVAGNAPNINAVAADATDIGTVAGKATEIGLLGTSAMATATTGHIPVLANVVEQTVNYTVTVASSKFNIQGGEYGSATETPALTLIRGYTYVFDTSDSTVATHPLVFKNGSATLGTSDGVTTDSASPGSTGAKVTVVVSDSVTITKYSCSSHGDTMGNTITLRHDDFKEVADNTTNITSVANNETNINTVAGISGNITTVASNDSNITSVAGNTTNINTVATNSGNVNTVATNVGNVNNVGNNITKVNSVADNISQVTTFADTYHTAGTTEPSGSNVDEGDLWFDTANDVLKVYDGSSWGSASSSIATVASQNEFSASNGQGTGNKYFALVHDVGLELVFLNGVRLKRGSDYYCTNSNTSTTPVTSGNAATFVRLETVPSTNDILSVMAFGQIANNLAVNTAGGNFTGGVTFEAGTTHNTGSNTFSMPTTRGADTYVLTRDDSVGTGGTTWTETQKTPIVNSITYPTQNGVQATALAATGAQDTTAETLLINGSNFTSTVTVNISGNGVSSSAFAGTVSVNGTGTVITCSNVTKQASADNYTLTITNSTGLTAITTVNFSADPSFTTASGSLGTVYTGVSASKTITAGSSVSWYEGTPTMPTWMTHFADGDTGTSKDLTGTPTNSGSTTSEVQNFNIIIRDAENQSHNRDFSLTVTDAPTGGDMTPATYTYNSVDYRVHKFTTVGSSNFVLYGTTSVDILLIGGGGGGASLFGGGGAGGLRWLTYTMTAGTYSVTVGNYGDGGSHTSSAQYGGQNGSASSIEVASGNTQSASGGGAGMPASGGSSGGSGGGGGAWGGSSYGGGGGNAGSYTPSEGNDGGAGSTDNTFGGAGGGAGGAGQSGNAGGAGGIGSSTFINSSAAETSAFLKAALAGTDSSNVATTGSSSGTLYIAAGGNAGRYGGTAGIHTTGALGGGGKSVYHSNATDGFANTGSGGGAGSRTSGSTAGGNGGSGVVIIRYAI